MHCSNGIGEGSPTISHALRRAIPSEDARSTWWGDRRGRAIVLRRLQHLRANPDRHGAVFRDIERALDAERMATSRSNAKNFVGERTPPPRPGLIEIVAHCPNMARIARSRLARISTRLARSSGSHTNSDTPVGMPFSSV
jgi:hypothetical protein